MSNRDIAINILNQFSDDDFTDIEDCLRMECAKDYNADYIITRNIKDYMNSSVQPILPSDFLKLI